MKPRKVSKKEAKRQREESPVKHRFFCLQAGKYKLLFDSKERAIRYLRWNADAIKAESGYAPNRVYYCTYCGGWHVTSSRKIIKYKEIPLEEVPHPDVMGSKAEELASESADSQRFNGMDFPRKDIPDQAAVSHISDSSIR